MRTRELIQARVETQTEGLGYVLAALVSAQPTNVEELRFFLEKIKTEQAEKDAGFAGDPEALFVASALLRGVTAFERE